jgi:hypothetical protein
MLIDGYSCFISRDKPQDLSNKTNCIRSNAAAGFKAKRLVHVNKTNTRHCSVAADSSRFLK